MYWKDLPLDLSIDASAVYYLAVADTCFLRCIGKLAEVLLVGAAVSTP
jgi:hypothetical protein